MRENSSGKLLQALVVSSGGLLGSCGASHATSFFNASDSGPDGAAADAHVDVATSDAGQGDGDATLSPTELARCEGGGWPPTKARTQRIVEQRGDGSFVLCLVTYDELESTSPPTPRENVGPCCVCTTVDPISERCLH